MAWLEKQLQEQVRPNTCTYLCHNPTQSRYSFRDPFKVSYSRLAQQSDRIVFTTVGVKDENQTATSDLSITVADRQALKLLEDSITQLQIILPSLLRTVVRLKSECDECCKITCSSQPHTCTCAQVLQRFDRYISELQMHVHRANVLKQEAKCVSQLVRTKFQQIIGHFLEPRRT